MDNSYSSVELFEGKNLSDLFKEIYDNSNAKRQQIKDLIASLSPLITGIGDATLLVPLIKEYLEIGVKNDEQLIKLAQIVQRLDSNKKAAGGGTEDIWSSFANMLQEDEQNGKDIAQVSEQVEQPQ